MKINFWKIYIYEKHYCQSQKFFPIVYAFLTIYLNISSFHLKISFSTEE